MRLPVVRQAAVSRRIDPEIVVMLGIILALPGFKEPWVHVRGVVDDHIHNDADAILMCLGNEIIHILESPEISLYIPVIAYIVSIIDIRRLIHRAHPYDIDT